LLQLKAALAGERRGALVAFSERCASRDCRDAPAPPAQLADWTGALHWQ
jgi:hypothetical protein